MKTDQASLPGMDPGEPCGWILEVENFGISYPVYLEAMSRTEARELFHDEFKIYDVGVEDDEFDWDHEVVVARSEEDAETIALERDRDYMRAYETSEVGLHAEIVSINRFDDFATLRSRRAKKEAEIVA